MKKYETKTKNTKRMRNIYTLILLWLAFSITTLAQSTDTRLQFVRGDGIVIESGSVVTFSNVEETLFGDMQIKPDIYLQNTSDDSIPLAVICNITSLPSGKIQFCAFGSCNSYSTKGEYGKTGLLNGAVKNDMQLEWVPEGKYDSVTGEYDYSAVEGTTATIIIQTEVRNADNNGIGSRVVRGGPSITINFVYPSASSIMLTKAKIAKEGSWYNLRGQRISKHVRGVNILKLNNGSVVKQIVK